MAARHLNGRRRGRARRFFESYTKDLTREDLQRLFTRDTQEAYRFFARSIDPAALAGLPWHRRLPVQARRFFDEARARSSACRAAASRWECLSRRDTRP